MRLPIGDAGGPLGNMFSQECRSVNEARYSVTWKKNGKLLVAKQPSDAELAEHAQRLADWYGDEYNRYMMAGTESLHAQDVIDFWAELRAQGGQAFLLYVDGQLVGDADLRHIETDRAEFAIMIGARDTQGQGLGTLLSVLIHAFAFETLKLSAVYLTIVPHNEPGRRCYEKVGYVRDDEPLARGYAEADDDIAMRITKDALFARHPLALTEIVISRN